MKRHRGLIAALLLATIVFGLTTRMRSLPWPDFVTEHFGDALWAVAVYLLVCFLRPAAKPIALFTAALAISFTVEFSQLASFPWLIEARTTLPGKLLLGRGFVWLDLLRYTAGVGAIFACDHLLSQRLNSDS